MARYYFHTSGARAYIDRVGTEISDFADVRRMAVKATAEVMADQSANWADRVWGMRVTDEAGIAVLTLDLAVRARVTST